MLFLAAGLLWGGLAGVPARAQAPDDAGRMTLAPTADGFVTCMHKDQTGYGSEPLLKVARNNARPGRKYNSYLKFDLGALQGREITAVEFSVHTAESDLKNERRVNLAVVYDNDWSEEMLTGKFRASNEYFTQSRAISYITVRPGDRMQYRTIRSTPDRNPALLTKIRENLSRGITELSLRLYPDEKRPDEDDDGAACFHARENREKAPRLVVYYR